MQTWVVSGQEQLCQRLSSVHRGARAAQRSCRRQSASFQWSHTPCRVSEIYSTFLTKTQAQAEDMTLNSTEDKTRVLFVCLGNICRSPAAEAVFKSVVEKAAVSDRFLIDSCGTGGGIRNWYKGASSYHEGGPADERMMEAAGKRGLDITSISRPLKPEDLRNFHYILGMDYENLAAIQLAADYWSGQGQPIPSNYRDKLSLMCSYLQDPHLKHVKEVPDPYWSDDERGFNGVLDLLEDSCRGLLEAITAKQKNMATA